MQCFTCRGEANCLEYHHVLAGIVLGENFNALQRIPYNNAFQSSQIDFSKPGNHSHHPANLAIPYSDQNIQHALPYENYNGPSVQRFIDYNHDDQFYDEIPSNNSDEMRFAPINPIEIRKLGFLKKS